MLFLLSFILFISYLQGITFQLLNNPDFGDTWDFRVNNRSEFFCNFQYCYNPFGWSYDGFAIVLTHPTPFNITCQQELTLTQNWQNVQLILTAATDSPLNFTFFFGNISFPLFLESSDILVNQSWNLPDLNSANPGISEISTTLENTKTGISFTTSNSTLLLINHIFVLAETIPENTGPILSVFSLISGNSEEQTHSDDVWLVILIILGTFGGFILCVLLCVLINRMDKSKTNHFVLREINPSD